MQYRRVVELMTEKELGLHLEVRGWVRSCRHSKEVTFIDVNDGSCLANLQVVAEGSLANYAEEVKRLTNGSAIVVRGEFCASPAQGQAVELRASTIKVVGWAAEDYPLQKKRHSFEFLRQISHLRPRTNSLGAVARIRSALSYAVHSFFKERGFFYVHTPIISTGDCEGAGETFTVSALNLEKLALQGQKLDWRQDFFGRQANLTVSGQLEAEAYAMALGRVYTFGPTFRAENSNTSRHLAEFWMVEPEMAFCDLQDDIDLAEEFLKYLLRYALANCQEDLALMMNYVDKDLSLRLENVAEKAFVRLSYDEAVRLLTDAKVDFSYQVQWGADLHSEHERFLTEQIFKQPVVVTDYPLQIKPFYMRANDDGQTVAAMDILFPGIGEIIGGSQREERLERLVGRMESLGMVLDEYQWYIDLRRYGSAPHAGFGLGFERIVQFVTGMKNIREVIPFPRTPGSAAF
ncbi:MAG: asparagine--tRNA ligase [Desulfobulbaceae bacterium]|nr:asparagine--tRNA ligase [Desulfobulbaceae bacterium]